MMNHNYGLIILQKELKKNRTLLRKEIRDQREGEKSKFRQGMINTYQHIVNELEECLTALKDYEKLKRRYYG